MLCNAGDSLGAYASVSWVSEERECTQINLISCAQPSHAFHLNERRKKIPVVMAAQRTFFKASSNLFCLPRDADKHRKAEKGSQNFIFLRKFTHVNASGSA